MKAITGLVGALGLLIGNSLLQAAIIAESPGGTTYTPMHPSYDGTALTLSEVLWNFTDPVSNQSSPITRPDGTRLRTGDLSRGDTPSLSDQLGYQRFKVLDQDANLTMTYLGGIASYQSIVGVYLYQVNADPLTAPIQYLPIFTQNVNTPGSSFTFTVAKDHYFGFYLGANASQSRDVYYTENFRNPDGSAYRQTQHFVLFQTNRGLLVAAEDLPYSRSTRQLGDQDYNDLFMTVSYSDSPNPVPEPVSLMLMASGGTMMLSRRTRRIPGRSSAGH